MKYFVWFFLILIWSAHTKPTSSTEKNSPYIPLKIFAQSLNIIEDHHPESKSRKDMIEGAIQGMLYEMDSYSHLMSPEQLKSFQVQNQSQMGGIGIQAASQNKQFVITNVFKNSSADKKGVQIGDIVTHINHQSIQKLPFDVATQKLQGKLGDSITLTVKRKTLNQPISISIPIKKFHIPSLTGKAINKHLFYVNISSFRNNSFQELKKLLKVKKCKKNQKKTICSKIKKGLLLDLRNNSGGPIDQALLIADLFISEGLLISARGKNEKYNQDFHAKKWGTLSHFPIVVLINEYTASASEILTSALKDNTRAFIVGQKSFGKGSLQTLFDLEEGYTLKLTIAHYFSSQGQPIHQKGIQPHLTLNSKNLLTKEELKQINNFKYKLLSNKEILKTKSTNYTLNSKWKKQMQKDPDLQKGIQILHQLTN